MNFRLGDVEFRRSAVGLEILFNTRNGLANEKVFPVHGLTLTVKTEVTDEGDVHTLVVSHIVGGHEARMESFIPITSAVSLTPDEIFNTLYQVRGLYATYSQPMSGWVGAGNGFL